MHTKLLLTASIALGLSRQLLRCRQRRFLHDYRHRTQCSVNGYC